MFVVNVLILACTFVLSGCGFKPLYREDAQQTYTLSQVKVAEIENREGQILKNHLDHTFNNRGKTHQPYTLSVKLKFKKNPLAISKSATTSQEAAHLSVFYTLTEMQTGKILLSATESFSSSTSVSADSPYSGWVTEKTIFNRLTRQAADSIRMNVTVALINHKTP